MPHQTPSAAGPLSLPGARRSSTVFRREILMGISSCPFPFTLLQLLSRALLHLLRHCHGSFRLLRCDRFTRMFCGVCCTALGADPYVLPFLILSAVSQLVLGKLSPDVKPAIVNGADVPSNITSVDNSTISTANETAIVASNVTLCDSGKHQQYLPQDLRSTPLLPSGLNNTSPKAAHHKGAGKTGAKDVAKKLAKGGKHHKNGNATAALPPCSSLDNDTSASDTTSTVGVNSSSTPEGNATPADGKKNQKTPPGKEDGVETVKIGDIARSLFGIPRMSRSPKRRLTPIPLWEGDED